MKKRIAICGMLVLTLLGKAETGFLKTLPAEEFATAGLQKLTPEELARLEKLIERYKTDEVVQVRLQADARAIEVEKESEKKIAVAEIKAKEALAKADEARSKTTTAETNNPVASGKKQPRWFMALVTLNHASEKPEKEEPLESQLTGNFSGWNGNTVFKLENGTQWVEQNKTESYVYSPILHQPKVKISPAAMRGFWLEIEGVNLRVRVVPFQLPESLPAKAP